MPFEISPGGHKSPVGMACALAQRRTPPRVPSRRVAMTQRYSAFSLENIGLKASVGDVFNKIAAHGSLRGCKQKRSTS